MATPTILYLHGFEEDASSPKPQALITDAKLATIVPALGVYLTKVRSSRVRSSRSHADIDIFT